MIYDLGLCRFSSEFTNASILQALAETPPDCGPGGNYYYNAMFN